MTGVEPTGTGGPHGFVDDLATPELREEDDHHFRKSLRVRVGDPVTVSDGRGGWRPCRMSSVGLEVDGDVISVERPEPGLTIGFALIKGGRPELVVQKLTELGVDTIAPVTSARSIVSWDEQKRARQQQRWNRIAKEAAMQSRRVWLPEIHSIASIDDAIAAADQPVALADPGGDHPGLELRSIFVGPEGGWMAEELVGRNRVRLGGHVLRAETAAIAAAVLMCAIRGHIVYAPRWS